MTKSKYVVRYELGWNKVPLFGTKEKALAFDTETSIDTDLEPGAINRLALVQVSDGQRTVLIHPDELCLFLEVHDEIDFVGHNVAYDFWIIEAELRKRNREDLVDRWWRRSQTGKLHCSMLLDGLIRLAEGRGEIGEDDKFYLRGLGDVALEYTGLQLDKQDPYRKKYGEIIGKKFSEVSDKGFWEYGAKDAYAQAHTWQRMYPKACKLARRFAHGMYRDSDEKLTRWMEHGVLTEELQVRGAIALAQCQRLGIPFDPDAAREDEAKWRPLIQEHVKKLEDLRPKMFKKKPSGKYEYAKKSLAPKVHQADLIEALAEAGVSVKTSLPEFEPPQSKGKTEGLISRAADDWEPYTKYSPFLNEWTKMANIVKRLGFYSNFNLPEKNLFSEFEPAFDYRLRSKINPLLKTGRTAYTKPNCQQFPRDSAFRAVFRVKPGKKLLTIDYSFIELRTLAATCLDRFGYSVLADVIKDGKDPHAFTAAIIKGLNYEEFMGLKKDNPKQFKDDRQAAKAVNFGVPGGLGAIKLVAYAAANYGVHFSVHEAEAFRRRLISDIYPELNDHDGYLADETYQALALNTGLSKGEVITCLPGNDSMKGWLGRVLCRIAGGATVKASGESYNHDFYTSCWDFLEGLGRKAPIDGPLSANSRKKLLARIGDPYLARDLTLNHAITLTGRVRSKVRFTVAKNTPFQGLAADGIKEAMFELCRRGYQVIALIHDELLVELDEEGAEVAAEEIKEIMCSKMKNVLGGEIPVDAEYHLGECWAK